jgi:predicted GIY-YIG superfamily endonuclease
MSQVPGWNCYLLATSDGGSQKTYVGVTPDLDRRLAQHNGIQSGGAKATHGRTWDRICHVRGFPDHRAALQFEWRWKQISRGLTGAPVQRRFQALQTLMGLDKPTSAAVPYSEYATPLEVIMESEQHSPSL